VLLRELPEVSYVALDFSAAMHQLAAARLGSATGLVQFIERSFREEGWTCGLEQFDAIVTNQAVHELRHKRHAARLHAQARACSWRADRTSYAIISPARVA
jgi:cyclopropane fatty-acyl-phospholipid synthase-like methyltransferase